MDMNMDMGMREVLICSWMRLVSCSVILGSCCLVLLVLMEVCYWC